MPTTVQSFSPHVTTVADRQAAELAAPRRGRRRSRCVPGSNARPSTILTFGAHLAGRAARRRAAARWRRCRSASAGDRRSRTAPARPAARPVRARCPALVLDDPRLSPRDAARHLAVGAGAQHHHGVCVADGLHRARKPSAIDSTADEHDHHAGDAETATADEPARCGERPQVHAGHGERSGTASTSALPQRVDDAQPARLHGRPAARCRSPGRTMISARRARRRAPAR